MVEATFINPYGSSSHSWDYGFIFREPRGDAPFLQIVVTSGKWWALYSGSDTPRRKVDEGWVSYLNTQYLGRNHLLLIAIGERGLFFVNGNFVATLDLSDVAHAGDVSLITGAFSGNERDGEVTRFEGYRVDHLTKEHGPVGGTITEPGTGTLGEHEAFGCRLVVWSIIRNPEFSWLDMVVLRDESRWMHYTRKPNDSDYTLRSYGALPDESVMWPDRVNRLSLVAIEDVGWLLLNDELLSKLDLSSNQSKRGVSGIAGFSNNHAGPVVSYEDFIVRVPGGR